MTENTPIPATLTFAEGRDLIANDLHSMVELFEAAEKRCRDGDIHAMEMVIDSMGRWQQMLAVRYGDRIARIEAGRQTQPVTATV